MLRAVIRPRSLFLVLVLVIVVALFGGLAAVLVFFMYTNVSAACMSVHHGTQHPRRPESVGNQTQVLQKSS